METLGLLAKGKQTSTKYTKGYYTGTNNGITKGVCVITNNYCTNVDVMELYWMEEQHGWITIQMKTKLQMNVDQRGT